MAERADGRQRKAFRTGMWRRGGPIPIQPDAIPEVVENADQVPHVCVLGRNRRTHVRMGAQCRLC